MKTNRTLEQIIRFNFIEYNHWQLICGLANNDYDINYYDGRITINSNFNDFLQNIDNFDIEIIINYLNEELAFTKKQNNLLSNENYVGCIDELNLLLKFVKQEYNET